MDFLPYSEFSLRLHDRAAGKRIPLSGTIEATRRCNHHCVHCYNNLPAGDESSQRNELTFQDHCRILDEIADSGCLWLLYTGGEIFVRNDFLDIYTYAKRKGLLITLFTNGALITEKTADYLADWRPFSIEITLYGRTPGTYDRVTNVPGSYERCLQGIRFLLQRDLPLKLKTMAISVNKHEIWAMKEFAEEELGLEFKFDAMINPRIDSSLNPLDVRLTPQEIVFLDLQDPGRMAEWERFAQQFVRPPSPDIREEMYRCGGGLSNFAIDPYGRLSPCALACVDTFDLRNGNFREGWGTFLSTLRSKKISRPTKCTACQLTALCGMCPANGQLENRDPETPVDFLCQVAHLRAEVLNISVYPHGECEYCRGGIHHQALLHSLEALRPMNRHQEMRTTHGAVR